MMNDVGQRYGEMLVLEHGIQFQPRLQYGSSYTLAANPSRVMVAERPIGRIEVVVLRRYPQRYVDSKNWKGFVAAACGRNETGLLGLVLWENRSMM